MSFREKAKAWGLGLGILAGSSGVAHAEQGKGHPEKFDNKSEVVKLASTDTELSTEMNQKVESIVNEVMSHFDISAKDAEMVRQGLTVSLEELAVKPQAIIFFTDEASTRQLVEKNINTLKKNGYSVKENKNLGVSENANININEGTLSTDVSLRLASAPDLTKATLTPEGVFIGKNFIASYTEGNSQDYSLQELSEVTTLQELKAVATAKKIEKVGPKQLMEKDGKIIVYIGIKAQ